jgi:hypothetical protein
MMIWVLGVSRDIECMHEQQQHTVRLCEVWRLCSGSHWRRPCGGRLPTSHHQSVPWRRFVQWRWMFCTTVQHCAMLFWFIFSCHAPLLTVAHRQSHSQSGHRSYLDDTLPFGKNGGAWVSVNIGVHSGSIGEKLNLKYGCELNLFHKQHDKEWVGLHFLCIFQARHATAVHTLTAVRRYE